jgi:hypothetical protein
MLSGRCRVMTRLRRHHQACRDGSSQEPEMFIQEGVFVGRCPFGADRLKEG